MELGIADQSGWANSPARSDAPAAADAVDVAGRYRRELVAALPMLLRRARRYAANEEDARELVQDTLVNALRRPPHNHDATSTWLTAVLRNRHIDRLRRPVAVITDEAIGEVHAACDAELPLWRTASDELLECCIAELSPRLREVVELSLQRVRRREIAKRLGVPLPTVNTRYHRAVRELRRLAGLRAAVVDIPRNNGPRAR